MFSAALDLLLPRACARCGGDVRADAALCAPCAGMLPRLPLDGCWLCQTASTGPDQRCAACRHQRSPLLQIAAEAAFADDVAEWIHRFKYPARGFAGLDPRPAAVVTALACDAAWRLAAAAPTCVIPVPIHRMRLRVRGFHPAAEVARAIGTALRLPIAERGLVALRETASQTGLDRRARRRNVAGAFAVGNLPPARDCVALVDDVVTTGATLVECARVLRRAGVCQVVAVCAARTL